MQDLTAAILNALQTIRIPAMPEEYEIHSAIETALTEYSIDFIHEAKIGTGCRIDFLCGDIGIEVKKGRPVASVLKKQITRYLSCESVNVLIVVLQKPCKLPAHVCNKEVHIVSLERLWGVALP